MTRFREWLSDRDPELYASVDENALKYIGSGARKLALAGLMGVAAMGGVDSVAKQTGNELPQKQAMDDELGDQSEELEERRRRKLRRVIGNNVAAGRHLRKLSRRRP